MRIAIVSDIHGNRTALAAVLKDLRDTAPDLVLHGGDLADSGSCPAEVIDQIRDLGWPGVLGNADEIYTRPESLDEFASQSAAPSTLWIALRERAAVTRAMLGENRISWMRSLPNLLVRDSMALLHASPESLWRSPQNEATDAELEGTYASLKKELVVYAHIHQPFVRTLHRADRELTIANTGSVSLAYDGDCRAAYLLLDQGKTSIRRVEYDIEKEIKTLSASGFPHSDWIAKMICTARPQLP